MNAPSFYSELSSSARIALLAGVLLIVVATAATLWWVLRPQQRLMFGNLREADAAEIVQSLEEWKVPYEIVNGGSGIEVPDDMVYATRMKLVSAGVPRGGHVGFELFDDSDFGVTEFAQRVNYQRALQGEIERTIAALPGVESARVHLTIRRGGLLAGERETSKASVAVTLAAGERLTRQQVNGIRSLVAAAVEGLPTDAVAVLDSNGSLLAGGRDAAERIAFDEREDEEGRLEARIERRVAELLGQVLHADAFHVTVDASLNFDAVREISERPLPQDGTPAAVAANAGKARRPDNEPPRGVAREEISRAPGRIERLSVAVILPLELADSEVERIEALVAVAAGLDVERGDRLEISRIGRALVAGHPVETTAPASVPVRRDVEDRRSAVAIATPLIGWALLVVAAIGGATVALLARRRPRRLRGAERDAMLAKMRGWLAEGTPL